MWPFLKKVAGLGLLLGSLAHAMNCLSIFRGLMTDGLLLVQEGPICGPVCVINTIRILKTHFKLELSSDPQKEAAELIKNSKKLTGRHAGASLDVVPLHIILKHLFSEEGLSKELKLDTKAIISLQEEDRVPGLKFVDKIAKKDVLIDSSRGEIGIAVLLFRTESKQWNSHHYVIILGHERVDEKDYVLFADPNYPEVQRARARQVDDKVALDMPSEPRDRYFDIEKGRTVKTAIISITKITVKEKK